MIYRGAKNLTENCEIPSSKYVSEEDSCPQEACLLVKLVSMKIMKVTKVVNFVNKLIKSTYFNAGSNVASRLTLLNPSTSTAMNVNIYVKIILLNFKI